METYGRGRTGFAGKWYGISWLSILVNCSRQLPVCHNTPVRDRQLLRSSARDDGPFCPPGCKRPVRLDSGPASDGRGDCCGQVVPAGCGCRSAGRHVRRPTSPGGRVLQRQTARTIRPCEVGAVAFAFGAGNLIRPSWTRQSVSLGRRSPPSSLVRCVFPPLFCYNGLFVIKLHLLSNCF